MNPQGKLDRQTGFLQGHSPALGRFSEHGKCLCENTEKQDKMNTVKHNTFQLAAILASLVVSCSTLNSTAVTPAASPTTERASGTMDRAQAEAIAWEALEPISHSNDRGHWLVIRAEQVRGREVEDEIPALAQFGCFHQAQPNPPIERSKIYWYVVFKPAPATPRPLERTPSPTEPPAIPEPFIQEARYLVDPEHAQVVAQAVYCIVY